MPDTFHNATSLARQNPPPLPGRRTAAFTDEIREKNENGCHDPGSWKMTGYTGADLWLHKLLQGGTLGFERWHSFDQRWTDLSLV
jgi:hypothetical protein